MLCKEFKKGITLQEEKSGNFDKELDPLLKFIYSEKATKFCEIFT